MYVFIYMQMEIYPNTNIRTYTYVYIYLNTFKISNHIEHFIYIYKCTYI